MKNKKTIKEKTSRGIFSYLRESKNYILLAIAIFAYFLLAGLIFPTPGIIEDKIREIIKQLIEQTSGLNGRQLIIYILQNNALVSFFGIIFGFIFGIVPAVILISNGYVLGYVFKIVISNEGVSSLWRILPHGIFELPAVIISMGLGLRIGGSLLKCLLRKNSVEEFFKNIFKALKIFFYLILPLLILAAIIEGVLIKLVG